MDLSEYKNKYPERTKRLERLESKGKIAELMLDLKDHAAMKMMEKVLAEKVNGINYKLLYKVEMTKEERDLLLTERDCWISIIDQFANSEQTIKSINDYLKDL